MRNDIIEAMIASPPERDELVVQMFTVDGGQWGEIYRNGDEYWIDLFLTTSAPLRFEVSSLTDSILRAKTALVERLGSK